MIETEPEIRVLMVAIDKTTNKEVYPVVDFSIGGGPMPTNTSEDINKIVGIMNNGQDNDLFYIDMFGISVNGVVDEWENIDAV